MAERRQRVVITGASRGIGAATARAFAAQGATVALLARDGAALQSLSQEIGNSAAFSCDLADMGQVAQAMAEAIAFLGGVDVLINNAGMLGPLGPLHEADAGLWLQTQQVNLGGVFATSQAVLPQMMAQGGGTIVTVSSGAAHRPIEGWSAYCASKAGAFMLTQSLHHDYAAQGIKVRSLSPGTVATQMQRSIKASGVGPVAQLAWEDHISPDYVAKALLWLADPRCDEPCGEEISLRDPAFRHRLEGV